MGTPLEDIERIQGIMNNGIEALEKHVDEKIDAGFKLLNETISHNYDRTSEQIKARVSDITCQTHREHITETIGGLGTEITILKTQKTILSWALGFLIPIALVGIVYGIITYQKVEDLRDKVNNNPQIVMEVEV